MYQNAIYIGISWYNKICWFPVKKGWCQQNSEGVSRDSYIFWIFFRQGITVPILIVAGYVWQILGSGGLFASPIRKQLRKCPSWIGLKNILLEPVYFKEHCGIYLWLYIYYYSGECLERYLKIIIEILHSLFFGFQKYAQHKESYNKPIMLFIP